MNNQAIETSTPFPWEETPLFRAAMKLHEWVEETQLRPGAKPYVPKARRSSWRALQAIVNATVMQDRHSAGYYASAQRYLALCALNIRLAGRAGALTEEEVVTGRALAHEALLEIPEAPFVTDEPAAANGSDSLGVEDEQQLETAGRPPVRMTAAEPSAPKQLAPAPASSGAPAPDVDVEPQEPPPLERPSEEPSNATTQRADGADAAGEPESTREH